MLKGKGKSVYEGIAIGRVYVHQKENSDVIRSQVDDIDEELNKFNRAKEESVLQLTELYEKAFTSVGKDEAMIMDAQLMMLEDLDFTEAILVMIEKEKINAAYAVFEAGNQFARIFSDMKDNPYMMARAADIQDIAHRIVMNIQGGASQKVIINEPRIVVAEDLSPSETIQFDRKNILAFVTKKGSLNSHTAILAKSMCIPALVGADIVISSELNGRTMIVDGEQGNYFLDPKESLLEEYSMRYHYLKESREQLQALHGKESITRSGQRVSLYANIGDPKEMNQVLENDVTGIGLFRSEFLYLGKKSFPTEEEQFAIYKEVAMKMKGKKVIIRTLDIGADKQLSYFSIAQEDNPAMGLRGVRLCFQYPEIFRTQLRAIYRAAVYGNISVMFPMIISVEEIVRIKEMIKQVQAELTDAAIPFGEVELGIMIETPAAVMVSEELAREVSFFSVGTNDLTQYTLAIDRQNDNLESFYDAHHPAVLRMLQMVADSAHKAGIWVGICGELAADMTMTQKLLAMGYDELSVSVASYLPIRKKIRECE